MSGAMKLVFAVAVAVCIAQVASAKVPRDAATTAAPAEGLAQLGEVVSRAQAKLTNISSEVATLLGQDLPQTKDEVLRVLNTQSAALKSKIEEFVGAIEGEVNKTRSDVNVSGLLEAITGRLNATLTTLQDSAPGVTKSATEVGAQIESGIRVVLEEAGKLGTTLGGEASTVQESLDKLARSAVDEAVSFSKQVEETVKSAIQTAPAST